VEGAGGKKYYRPSSGLTWKAARAKCASFGNHLAVWEGSLEFNKIKAFAGH